MPAALAVDVNQVGAPLGAITLSGTPQEVEFTMDQRLNGVVQVLAIDADGTPVGFLYSTSAAGLQTLVPAGSGVKLPVSGTQSWWFEQDTSAAPTLQLTCVG